MKAIEIDGLRSLLKIGKVDIKPINLILGANSSGKSSFLRSFPLLKQSIERPTKGPILWNGIYTDFDSFQTSLFKYKGDDSNEVSNVFFGFDLVLDKNIGFDTTSFYDKNEKRHEKFKMTVSFTLDQSDDSACYTKYLEADFFNKKIKIEMDYLGNVFYISLSDEESSFTLNLENEGLEFKRVESNTLIPVLESSDSLFALYYKIKDKRKGSISVFVYDCIIDHLTRIFGINDKNKRNLGILNRVARSLCSSFRDDDEKRKVLKKYLNKIYKEENDFFGVNQKDLFFLIDAYVFLTRTVDINHNLTSVLRNVHYIAPLRASIERYYRYQDLAVDEIDHRGENIGMFLNNMPDSWKLMLDDWTLKYFDFHIDVRTSLSHIAINILYKHEDKKYSTNVADLGFGYSQALPIIVQLWSVASGYEMSLRKDVSKQYIFAIEQPELHLHPKMQAQLADAFVAAIELSKENEIDLRLIIETHSSSLVSRFGDIIVESDIEDMKEGSDRFRSSYSDSISDNRDVSHLEFFDYSIDFEEVSEEIVSSKDFNVLIFNKNSDSNITELTVSEFNSDGELENWPNGFFNY